MVLSDTGSFETVEVERQRPDPMTLQVKEVTVEDTPGKGAAKAPPKPRRYVVCRNPDQARKDAATRAQLLAALESKLRNDGPKSVVASKGYKRYLKAEKGAFAIDLDKARDEERLDGMWVLRTNTELSAVEVALRYKQLWMVEQVFRTAKSLLDTRPIFHKTDATICGHVFCSFLALVLWRGLRAREGEPGRACGNHDVPSAGRLPQRVLRVARPWALFSCQVRRGVAQHDCRASTRSLEAPTGCLGCMPSWWPVGGG